MKESFPDNSIGDAEKKLAKSPVSAKV